MKMGSDWPLMAAWHQVKMRQRVFLFIPAAIHVRAYLYSALVAQFGGILPNGER
jgi:hypothetical protein